ncbi:MAG: HDIG domain-containing protein [Desulfobacterales bacterium]|nr:HDIG domain-containing protein [Desulfobacterales bacterium]
MNKKILQKINKTDSLNVFLESKSTILWGILIVVTLVFTLVFYPGEDKLTLSYEIGDIASRDIKAPKDFFIEDKEATEQKIINTKDLVKIVYDFDSNLRDEIVEGIQKSFDSLRELIKENSAGKSDAPLPPFEIILKEKQNFEKHLGITISNGAFKILYNNRFSKNIAGKITIIISEILSTGVVANKELLLKEQDKGIILRTISSSEESLVTKLKGIYGIEQAQTMVRIVGDPLLKNMNYNLSICIVDLSQLLIRPNITINTNETKNRIEKAVSEIKPVLYKIKAGEMILREGERVSEIKLVKLKTLKSQIKDNNRFRKSIGMALVTFLCLLVVYILFLKDHMKLQNNHSKNMLFIASMLFIFLLIAKLSIPMANLSIPIAKSASTGLSQDMSSVSIFMGIPLPAGAMTICFFLGFEVALFFAIALSILTALLFSSSLQVFIFFFLSSVIGAYWIKECNERKDFIVGGFKLAVFNVFIIFALSIYSSARPDVIIILKEIALAFSGGIIAGIISAGLTPLIEMFFGYTTKIKLLEFANLDQPIMKRLMIEAPGTYNHSVIVATLAEAAASAIGANHLRTKVCAYYHDIGKLGQPLYFIENQANGKNRHDKVSPSMSALILIKHVKKGVELAKENKLSVEVIDTIQQHHGTTLIQYFYNKHIQLKGEDQTNEANFRYPGPKPQTREAGIVMLADVVEAAARTLERPTSARIQGKVKDLINSIFADGQLDECELTLKDLHEIAKNFNNILTGIYHSRIEYPEKTKENQKEKNGKPKDTNKQQTKPEEAAKGQNQQKDSTDLKRLGI